MSVRRTFKVTVAVLLMLSLAFPHTAYSAEQRKIHGIKIKTTVTKVVARGALKGAIVDQQGQPVSGAPVAIGRQGKVVAKLKTNTEGCYEVAGLTPGTYQLVSFAGVEAFTIVEPATPGSVKGIVQVIDQQGIVRGQQPGWMELFLTIFQNPIIWVVAIVGAIAIPVALDDDAS